MVPTIDFGNLSVTAAIGAFFCTVWTFIVRAFNFFKDKAVFFFCATKTGRSVAEFIMFGIIYTVFGRGITWLVTTIGGFAFDRLAPESMVSAFEFISNFIPVSRIVSLILYGFTLWRLSFTIDVFYAVWHRNLAWLNRAMTAGRV